MNRKERRQSQARERRAGGAPMTQPAGESAMLFAQGGAALQAGRWREAEFLFSRVIQNEPAHADAHNWLAVAAGQQGKNRDALEHFARAVALAPASADFVNNLGLAQLNAGDLDAAQRSFETALRLNPQLPVAHYNLGLVFQKKLEFDSAVASFRRAIALAPNYVNAHLNLGNALQDGGRFDEAIAQFRKLVALAPNSRESRFNLARALRTAKQYAVAADEARNVVALDPKSIEARLLLVQCLFRAELYDEADAEARQILAMNPASVEAHNTRGNIFLTLGKFDEAIASFEAALSVNPGDAEAIFGLTYASKACSTPAMASRIETLVRENPPQEQKSLLHFALGKVYDDIGDYPGAFENYRLGNDLAVPDALFDPEIWTAFIDRLIATFTPEFFAQRRDFGSASERPVFIVGMPRSGTTLTEQIIASHPRVAAGGEMQAIAALVAGLPGRLKSARPFPECADELNGAAVRDMAAEYLAALDKFGAGTARTTDKMPMNFQNLGLMALMFPRAAFIHCRRDPLDTCLSCYFAKFGQHLDFSYSQPNLAAYFRGYARLMSHWRRVLPVRLLEVDYEDMVADQEGVSRRLIAHCGLPWDDRCLAFDKTERAVRTASVWQVRQPIYKTSVKRWQRYESFLQPLKLALAAGPNDSRTGTDLGGREGG